MNKNQLNRLQLIQSLKHNLDPDITFTGNLLILETKKTKLYEYIISGFLLLAIPSYFLWESFSTRTVVISISLFLGIAFLLYDSVIASNKVIIDLNLKKVNIIPNNQLVLRLGLAKQRSLIFEQIQRTRLSDKSFGRGQPLGKRLYIETKDHEKIKLFDFRSGMSAEKFESLLSDLLEVQLIRK